MQKDWNGYKYNFFFLPRIYFSPIKVLKSKKKKLTMILLYYLEQ